MTKDKQKEIILARGKIKSIVFRFPNTMEIKFKEYPEALSITNLEEGKTIELIIREVKE